MSEKSLANFYSKFLFKMGQYFLDIQCTNEPKYSLLPLTFVESVSIHDRGWIVETSSAHDRPVKVPR